MSRKYQEHELAALARQARIAAGKSLKEAAAELGVSSTSLSLAENKPERSLFLLRKRAIEKYSNYRILGPEYRLEKKNPSR